MPTLSPRLSLRDYRALAEVRYRIRAFLTFSEDAARDAGIEPQQHQLLLAVRGLPAGASATIKTLAARLQIQHHSAVELATRAEASALVRRHRSVDDRRVVTLGLTPHGARVLERLSHEHRRELSAAAAHLISALRTLTTAGRRRPRGR